jgi:hypothetical protein
MRIKINVALYTQIFLLALATVGNVHTSRRPEKQNIFGRSLLRLQQDTGNIKITTDAYTNFVHIVPRLI